jgi:type I restriction enzyme M protein
LAEARATANAATNHATPNDHAGLIWAIADLLRGDYKRSEYGRVILPLVLLRRLDCVLEPTKAQVLARAKTLTVQTVGPVLKTVTGIEAYNTSRLNLRAILADPGYSARLAVPSLDATEPGALWWDWCGRFLSGLRSRQGRQI